MKTKKILLASLLLLSFEGVFAQWTPNTTNTTSAIGRTGFVGFGTTTPRKQVHIHNETADHMALTGIAPGILFSADVPSDPIELLTRAAIGLATNYQHYFPTCAPGDFAVRGGKFGNVVFGTIGADYTQTIERMRIAQNGNVTINNSLTVGNNLQVATLKVGNTNVPAGYKFAVDGKAICTELKVKAPAVWPDYVFDASYSLRSIDELEQYINENNHLPNIPSAEEVQKEGIEVADMSKRLLEKIEELTLYMIAIKKENAIMKNELQLLRTAANKQ